VAITERAADVGRVNISIFRRVVIAVLTGLAVFVPAMPASAAGTATWWHPTKGLTWQWQLSGRLDLTVNAAVYDVDAVDATAADVAALHRAGRKAICYVDVGSYEKGRPDAARFPAAVIGKVMDGWPDERWVDIRRWDVLGPILRDRFATCVQKGFDGVEPDNVDGYANRTGFPLTAADQLAYNRNVADLAHRLGLAVGLKNDVDQARTLAPAFDFAVNEECADYDECDPLSVFVKAGKPVFHTEYSLRLGAFCAATKKLGFSSIRKHLALDAWRQSC
jgi:hypothetical protein